MAHTTRTKSLPPPDEAEQMRKEARAALAEPLLQEFRRLINSGAKILEIPYDKSRKDAFNALAEILDEEGDWHLVFISDCAVLAPGERKPFGNGRLRDL